MSTQTCLPTSPGELQAPLKTRKNANGSEKTAENGFFKSSLGPKLPRKPLNFMSRCSNADLSSAGWTVEKQISRIKAKSRQRSRCATLLWVRERVQASKSESSR